MITSQASIAALTQTCWQAELSSYGQDAEQERTRMVNLSISTCNFPMLPAAAPCFCCSWLPLCPVLTHLVLVYCPSCSEEDELVCSKPMFPRQPSAPVTERINTALQRQAELFSCPINQWAAMLYSDITGHCPLLFSLPKRLSEVNDRKPTPLPIHRQVIFQLQSLLSIVAAWPCKLTESPKKAFILWSWETCLQVWEQRGECEIHSTSLHYMEFLQGLTEFCKAPVLTQHYSIRPFCWLPSGSVLSGLQLAQHPPIDHIWKYTWGNGILKNNRPSV